MKLSEAMRLGSMLRPQGFGWFQSNEGTCAIGAAHEAVRDPREREEWMATMKVARAVCPACGIERVTTNTIFAGGSTIVHLNDEHRWSREQIADWVEGIEQAQEAESRRAVAESGAETETVTPSVRLVPLEKYIDA